MTAKPMGLLAGIDIGSDRVRTVLARAPDSFPGGDGMPQLEVLAVGTAESGDAIEHGEVVRPGPAADAVRRAVEELEQTAGLELGSAYVSVGSRNRRSTNSSGTISMPEARHRIDRADVYRAVMAAVPRSGPKPWLRPPYELLHAIPQQFRVDNLDPTNDPAGWTGESIESHVHLVSCPRTTLHRIEEAVNGAGIEIEQLVAAPLAAGYGVLDADDHHKTMAVLDIGAMNTDIGIFRRGVLRHSDLMPSGGLVYTSDIATVLSISLADAERAKRSYGVAFADLVREHSYVAVPAIGGGYPKQWRRRLVAEILERRARSHLTKIRDQLQRVFRELPGTIVLTGGGSNLHGLNDVARLVFDADVESRGPRNLTGRRDQVSGPHFATVVGLCRYGLMQHLRSHEPGSPLAHVRRAIRDGLRHVTSEFRRTGQNRSRKPGPS